MTVITLVFTLYSVSADAILSTLSVLPQCRYSYKGGEERTLDACTLVKRTDMRIINRACFTPKGGMERNIRRTY